MAKGDRTAVYVGDFVRQSEFVHHGQRLNCEGLIQLDQTQIVNGQPGTCERLAGGRDGAERSAEGRQEL